MSALEHHKKSKQISFSFEQSSEQHRKRKMEKNSENQKEAGSEDQNAQMQYRLPSFYEVLQQRTNMDEKTAKENEQKLQEIDRRMMEAAEKREERKKEKDSKKK